jgi:uncharacterized protein with HEPN domain
MPIEEQIRLSHMLEAAREINQFVKDRKEIDLQTDRKLFLALLALFQILGEAAKHVSETTREAHPEIEWSGPSRMRDKLAHAYFQIDFKVLWDAATVKIPMLISQLEPLVTQSRLDLE